MSMSFPKTMRSLNSESFRPSLAALVFTILLLAAWVTWFFAAKVPIYETSTDLVLDRDGIVLVKFSKSALSKIYPGQEVRLHLNETSESPATSLKAVVMDLPSEFEGEDRVEVYVFSEDDLPEYVSGEARVTVEHISPATLVMRSTGEILDND